MKNYTNLRLRQETLEQREFRYAKIKKRLANETSEQRAHRLDLIQNRLDNESPEQRAHRLGLIQNRLDNESPEQRAHRPGIIHNRLANESAQEREKRLTTMRQSSQRQRSMIECNFINTINQYAEEPCTVCKKILSPKQKMVLVPTRFEFLPQEVAVLEKIIVCSRCSTTIKKRKVPSQAYWNNMEVMSLPPELADLTDVEQRLLSRVVPFMKIIKLQNRFRQCWCRGQVILFAQDVVEVAEQLPLPLAQAGIVVVVETRDNLPNHKQFQVDIRKIKITFQGSCVNLNIAHDLSINGHFSRDQEGYPNLENGIASFFDNNYTCGILTANFISVCTAYKNLSYWLIDSHSRGPKGHKGRTGGVSCCLRFENSRQIAALLRSNLKATGLPEYILNIYSITPVFVVESGGHIRIESQHSERNLNVISSSTNLLTSNLRTENVEDFSSKSTTFLDLDFREVIKNLSGDRRLILTTSMLYDIDENIPNLDSVIESDNRNLNENRVTDIHRKTAPLIVNIERERRMEELCWYTMYPDGKNGFGKSRNISITALDYFQARVMSNETRFQKVDYLVFALSVVGYFRAKASVSVSCRMRQGQNELVPQGLVDNIHLNMRNIRGSASYWKRCCAELMAMVRSLGAPTWFATFSCNDLNWPDMLRALLIADGRKEFDFEALTFQERLDLFQKYPVVLARQFTLRVNALISFIKKNNECFGGPVVDFWYRIEFQNRGSPHLHMLLWCKA
ncbi:hypothetical protein HF086_014773 [Spodoptera exigua]|uniref:Helitron helicase-like domain-containing protein n=1 Tax=Spodoptera exigua TaxID=7107 RepID=A0A922SHQ8_SPOEX|nr:hypothetical protein HF086_014773 [Spodoptera exigua]